ncbi:unnamed protein product [Somion occarium]|uniref:Uncharacterized protein n=1 Tax=Somion occarium TaxID=3059160 RepID=A0ABP1D6B0_9APHY
MTGTQKRAAEDEPTGRRTRSAKAAKTEGASQSRKGGKKGPKTSLGANSFKSRALPLHVNVTHTPPAIPDDETINATSADPGFIGTTALVPTVFNTGSYGWKGNKRVTIELQNNESGEKEKVHVMLTINATVMGSKNAKDDEAAEGEEKEPEAEEGLADTEMATQEGQETEEKTEEKTEQ